MMNGTTSPLRWLHPNGRLSSFRSIFAPHPNGRKYLPRGPRFYSGKALGTSLSVPQVWGSHSIFVSLSDDPYFNLSLEDVLFRKHDVSKPLLLIYRDKPCVVIGRNQNPWKEVNFHELGRLGIPVCTVYHDHGNTNFSIHLPRSSFDRHVTAQTILRAVQSLGIDGARLNDRNDLCVGAEKIGSAYKIVNNRAYHHGTMLISTKLDTLGDLLRVKGKENMVTKGVASVRSPVCNLQQYNPEVTHEAFTNAVVAHHFLVPDSQEFRCDEDIRKGIEELPTWAWAYGQTPEFTFEVQQTFSWGSVKLNLRSKHGVVLESTSQILDGTLDESGDIAAYVMELNGSLVGQRYGFWNLDGVMQKEGHSAELALVVEDLKRWISEIA
ncbi:Lipoyltransferase and lipoate-protein ligase [Ephemerocybe angulata]|uniref:Putative lipoate-protein ligase A n=1 Tax=Ephemerocybe angulata TaxID=980116 RepID=A0A8H6HND8_9AGAR|nr:Lipoyltransferase and lipoate-protein ligase [Tulosesus angulatus]